MHKKFILSKQLLLAFSFLLYFGNPITSYGISPSENCPSDLLFLLRLDEASGPDYADIYGVNNAVASNSPTAVTGIINGGQLFNNNTYVNIHDNGNDFEWAEGCSFSLEFWIKSATHAVPQVGISRQIAGGTLGIITWWMGINENGGAVMEISDNKSEFSYAVYNKDYSKSYTDNQWHHFVGIKDGTTDYMAIYVDGELVEGKTAVFNGNFIAPSPTDVSIGYMKRADGASFEYHVNGALDEVAVYTRALTQDEIISFYNNGAPEGHCASTYKTVITSRPATTATEDVAYSYNFTVKGQDGDTLTLSAITKPDWLNFNWTPGEKSAILSGTPDNGNTGTANVTLSVNDGDSTLYQSFTINVAAVNHIPVITGQRTITLDEDTKITISNIDLTITDVDNPPSDITLQVLEGSNYTFEDNLVTPNADFNGPLYVNVIAKDLVGQSLTYPVLITVLPVNDAPVITTTPQLMVNIDHLYLYNMLVTDTENDNLTITVTGKPDWLNFTPGSNSADLSGTPTIADLGSYDIVLSVDDGTVNVDQSFTIKVEDINDIPVITGQNSLSINEDTKITLSKSDLVITDVDNPSSDLTLQVLEGSNYSFDGNEVTPDENFNGPLYVNVIVKDLIDQSQTYPALITVLPVNDLSVITTSPQLTVGVGDVYQYEMMVTDVDQDILTFEATIKPDWLTFTASSNFATLTGLPTLENVGSHPVVLSVNDGHDQITKGFTISVTGSSALEKIDNSKLNLVYPNPANDRVYFKFANSGASIVEIYNLTGGLLIRTQSDSNDLIDINIADFPKGIYLYKTFQDNKISCGKIVRN